MQPTMNIPRVGRNDPCPCGSGKKYKHCHMLQEQQATLSRFQNRRARETAYEKLAAFVQGERFVPDLAASFDLFWNNRLSAAQIPQLIPLHRMRSLDYFLFDYRTADGDRVVDRFSHEQRARLTAEEKTALKQWSDAYMGAYAIQQAEAETITVRDVILGGVKRIESALPPPLANPAIALIGRLTATTPAYFVHDLVLPMPVDKANELVEWLKPKYSAYQAQRAGAKWPEFLRASSHLFNHFLLEDPDFLPLPAPSVAKPDPDAEIQIAQTAVRQVHSGLIIGSLDQHYGQWLDKPIEGWGNRSPRQLMADELGRARVEVLLKVLETAEERRREIGQPAYDVRRLRAQLGMLGPGVF